MTTEVKPLLRILRHDQNEKASRWPFLVVTEFKLAGGGVVVVVGARRGGRAGVP